MPDGDPLFSVITVTRDNLSGLMRTAESLRGQSIADYEWLVIDGGSKDGTRVYLAASDSDDLHWISEPDQGPYDAMNKGVDSARGHYLMFMNAGDIFADAGVLENTSLALRGRAAGADVVYGDALELAGSARLLKTAFHHDRIWYSMFTHHQAMFYRRRAIGTMRYRPALRIAADWALTAQMHRNGARFERLDFPVCLFERGGLSQLRHRAVVRQMRQERLWVYANIFNMPAWRAHLILAVKQGSERLRGTFPGLYDRLRFRRGGP